MKSIYLIVNGGAILSAYDDIDEALSVKKEEDAYYCYEVDIIKVMVSDKTETNKIGSK